MEIKFGDNLAKIIFQAAKKQGECFENGDVLVVTQKIVSKAEGKIVNLSNIKPSKFAYDFSAKNDKDPRLVQLILDNSKSLIRLDENSGTIISETFHGFICANAGIDSSNIEGDEFVSLLPDNSDKSALVIRNSLKLMGKNIALIIEALTDNKNRTASSIRSTLQKFGGNLGSTGSTKHFFYNCLCSLQFSWVWFVFINFFWIKNFFFFFKLHL